MNYIEKLNKSIDYENKNNVQDYIVDGWHVWPLLRTAFCLQFFSENKNEKKSKNKILYNAISVVYSIVKYFRAKYKLAVSISYKENRLIKKGGDVLMLSLSSRKVFIDDSYYDIYTDPLGLIIKDMGLSVLVLEQGNKRSPQFSESLTITNLLDLETQALSLLPRKIKEPKWFSGYTNLVELQIGRVISWNETAKLIENVTDNSKIFEKWIKQSKAKYIFVVCWYDPIVMAAILAARRCGIKVIDIQHGVQGKGHFGYSSWNKVPYGGYESIPDIFWCWGKISANELLCNNKELSKTVKAVAGGNLWLNKWCDYNNTEEKKIDAINGVNSEKRILVTMQENVHNILLQAINSSPIKWVWIIRFHPARKANDREKDIIILKETGNSRIEFDTENKFLLYNLLNDCDIHVTESSSCALEALAFGVISVILGGSELGETGKDYYKSFIKKKLMLTADSPNELINVIAKTRPVNPNIKDVTDYFTNTNDSKYLLKEIFS
jgi:hypothetical protein